MLVQLARQPIFSRVCMLVYVRGVVRVCMFVHVCCVLFVWVWFGWGWGCGGVGGFIV